MNDTTSSKRPHAYLATGVGAAIATWTAWYVLHLPAIDAPAPLTVALLVATNALILALGGRAIGSKRALKSGIAAGIASGAINLLLLGSKIVEQPATTGDMESSANNLRADAPLIIIGFLIFSAILGAAASLIGASLANKPPKLDAQTWLGRLGFGVTLAFLPLLIAGGAVTSTESALAVPDPITSYGAVSFLFPYSLMAEDRIFFEHAHRLLGSLVGLATLILMVRVLIVDTRTKTKILYVVLFLGVCAQGVAGMIRVEENLAWVAAIHGIVAQILFAFAMMLYATLSPKWLHRDGGTIARSAPKLSAAALICVLIQLSFGALYRHLGTEHALWSHVGFSLIVAAAAVILGLMCTTAKGGPLARSVKIQGIHLIVFVSLQFALGWIVLMVVLGAEDRGATPTSDQLATAPTVPAAEALLTTIHQALGAAIFALTALVTVWIRGLDPVRGHIHAPNPQDSAHSEP